MRISSRWRWAYMGAIGVAAISALVARGLVAQPPGSSARSAAEPTRNASRPAAAADAAGYGGAMADEGYGMASGYGGGYGAAEGMGGYGVMAGFGIPLNFTLVSPNGDVEGYTAARVYTYVMEPGTAKPKRIQDGTGGDTASMPGMGSAMGGYGSGEAMPMPDAKRWPVLYAFGLKDSEAATDRTDQPVRATIKVAVQMSDVSAGAGMGGGMGSMEGMEMMGTITPATAFIEIDAEGIGEQVRASSVLRNVSSEERTNLAQLIRLDVWIENARTALQARRNKPKEFALVESHLKELLSEEYDALLSKQRADAERLRKRLDQLQADLERRAKAKDRVVDVQLGKLVLEAQGLIDTQR